MKINIKKIIINDSFIYSVKENDLDIYSAEKLKELNLESYIIFKDLIYLYTIIIYFYVMLSNIEIMDTIKFLIKKYYRCRTLKLNSIDH